MTDLERTLATERKITLKLPGTTSNLGPGLDCLGLALNLYSKMSFYLLPENDPGIPLITFKGPIAKSSLAQDQGSLTYTILSRLWQRDQNLLQRVRILIDSEIPLGVGLGSTSTAILGALWAANVFKDRIPTAPSLLAEACELEGHAENLAACLLGSFVVCGKSSTSNKIVTQRLHWPAEWHLLVVSPKYSLNTPQARKILPREVKFEDALHNVQKTALMVAAITRNDDQAMNEALDDRLHEPYRAKLVPELSRLRQELTGEPIIGCVLSGAGSSVLVIVNEKRKAQVLEHIQAWAASEPKPPSVLDLQVDYDGIAELEI
jgi:homoserine kinase